MYNLKVLPASLFVDFNLSFLAASLDGLIENDAPDDAQKQNKLKFMEKRIRKSLILHFFYDPVFIRCYINLFS